MARLSSKPWAPGSVYLIPLMLLPGPGLVYFWSCLHRGKVLSPGKSTHDYSPCPWSFNTRLFTSVASLYSSNWTQNKRPKSQFRELSFSRFTPFLVFFFFLSPFFPRLPFTNPLSVGRSSIRGGPSADGRFCPTHNYLLLRNRWSANNNRGNKPCRDFEKTLLLQINLIKQTWLYDSMFWVRYAFIQKVCFTRVFFKPKKRKVEGVQMVSFLCQLFEKQVMSKSNAWE